MKVAFPDLACLALALAAAFQGEWDVVFCITMIWLFLIHDE